MYPPQVSYLRLAGATSDRKVVLVLAHHYLATLALPGLGGRHRIFMLLLLCFPAASWGFMFRVRFCHTPRAFAAAERAAAL
jgi:hypothetical protein